MIDVVVVQHYFCRVLVIPAVVVFCVRGQVIPAAEFGVETRRIVVCASRDVTIGEISFNRQIETMVLQGACKRLYNANKRF